MSTNYESKSHKIANGSGLKRKTEDKLESGIRKNLKITPIPVPAEAQHPRVPFDTILPKHEFTLGLIAPKGSGKTTTIANYLDFTKGYFEEILIFSPTIFADEKWDYVKAQNLISENKRLIAFLKKKGRDDDTALIGKKSIVPEQKAFSPKIPEENFKTDYDEGMIHKIVTTRMEMEKELKKMGGTKHLMNRMLIIFDDMVGSGLFNNRKDNVFKKLNANHRHVSVSMIMVSQGYKEIPKLVRTNWTCLIFYEIANESELNVIYEENPVSMPRDRWQMVYEHCTMEDYGFVYINYSRPKKLRVMKNFEQVLYFDKKRDREEEIPIDPPKNKKIKT